MNLIETNQQINMSFDHSFSYNNLFKCLLNASSCAVAVARVTWRHKGDVNSVLGENWKEPSSSTTSSEKPFKSDSNEDALNANKTC